MSRVVTSDPWSMAEIKTKDLADTVETTVLAHVQALRTIAVPVIECAPTVEQMSMLRLMLAEVKWCIDSLGKDAEELTVLYDKLSGGYDWDAARAEVAASLGITCQQVDDVGGES